MDESWRYNSKLPKAYKLLASTNEVVNAAYSCENESIYGLQFHPEVYHSNDGQKLISNFLIQFVIVNKIGLLSLLLKVQ